MFTNFKEHNITYFRLWFYLIFPCDLFQFADQVLRLGNLRGRRYGSHPQPSRKGKSLEKQLQVIRFFIELSVKYFEWF